MISVLGGICWQSTGGTVRERKPLEILARMSAGCQDAVCCLRFLFLFRFRCQLPAVQPLTALYLIGFGQTMKLWCYCHCRFVVPAIAA